MEPCNKLACYLSRAKSSRERTVLTCPVKAGFKKASKPTDVGPHPNRPGLGTAGASPQLTAAEPGGNQLNSLVQGTERLLVPPILPSEGKGDLPSPRVEGTRWSADTQLLQRREDWERWAAPASSSKKLRMVSPGSGKRSN